MDSKSLQQQLEDANQEIEELENQLARAHLIASNEKIKAREAEAKNEVFKAEIEKMAQQLKKYAPLIEQDALENAAAEETKQDEAGLQLTEEQLQQKKMEEQQALTAFIRKTLSEPPTGCNEII